MRLLVIHRSTARCRCDHAAVKTWRPLQRVVTGFVSQSLAAGRSAAVLRGKRRYRLAELSAGISIALGLSPFFSIYVPRRKHKMSPLLLIIAVIQ